MEKILEDNFLRHYKMLNYLVFKEWVPINEVASHTGLSERTIQKDIGEINAYIAPAKIETSLKRGIRITYPHDLNSFYLFSTLLKQSTNFLILEEIFKQPFATLNQLAEHLFLSESTLKRKIHRINTVLAPDNWRIDSVHLDFVGDEKKITRFFHNYFIEKYTVLDGVVTPSELEVLSQLIGEFNVHYPELVNAGQQNFSNLNRARILLFIRLRRLARHHDITYAVDENRAQDFTLSPLLLRQVQQKFGVIVGPKETRRLFYKFFNPLYAWSLNNLAEKIKLLPTTTKIMTAIDEALAEIRKAEHLPMPNLGVIRLNLYNLLVNTWANPKILFLAAEEFFGNLNNYYENFTRQVRAVIDKKIAPLADLVYINEAVLTMFHFTLVTSWDQLGELLEKRAPVVRAGLFLNTSYDHSQFIMRDILYHIKSRLTIEIVEAATIADFKQATVNFDLIITNLSSVTLDTCPLISIHSNPTAEDFFTILAEYNALIHRKVDMDIQEIQKAHSIFS